MDGVRAVLIDIDGVLTVSWKPLPGAVEAVEALRSADLPFALVTNTTSRTRARIAETLADAGFPVGPDDVLGAPAATAAHLREHHPGASCLLLSSGDVADDLDGIRLVDPDADDVDVVVLGGAGPEFSYDALDTAYRHLQHGAALVAMHRNLYWRTDAGLQLDAGAFLLGLEKAADTEAVVLGKPSGAFFAAALSSLGVGRSEAVMVGDDLEADVLGAQRAGITGVLVRTGKFSEKDEEGDDRRDAPPAARRRLDRRPPRATRPVTGLGPGLRGGLPGGQPPDVPAVPHDQCDEGGDHHHRAQPDHHADRQQVDQRYPHCRLGQQPDPPHRRAHLVARRTAGIGAVLLRDPLAVARAEALRRRQGQRGAAQRGHEERQTDRRR